MTLEEAIAMFPSIPLTRESAVAVPMCCGTSVVQNSQDDINRIFCGVCGRQIREVGHQWVVWDWGSKGIVLPRHPQDDAELARHVANTVAEEREACAKIAEAFAQNEYIDGGRTYSNGYRHAAERIAAAIRTGGGSL